MSLTALKGNIISAPELGELDIREDGYLVLEDGKILGVFDALPEQYQDAELEDHTGKLILQSFGDMHLHAPQYPQLGLGLDLQLLDWLSTYTFPLEARMKDTGYAREVYTELADRLIHAGTTRAIMFSSFHTDATLVLMECMEKAGITGYVGKINMDVNGAPDYYQETTEESERETLRWLDACGQFRYIKPIITPRFAVSCTGELMEFLGKTAKERGLYTHSHLSENPLEIALVKELFPDCEEYWDVYNKYGLWKDHSVMAHCCYSSEREIDALRDGHVLAVHCPDSNTNVCSGIMSLIHMLDRGVWVALGSDIAGGSDYHMNRAITAAIKISDIKRMESGWTERFLTVEEGYYLATSSAATYFGAGKGFCKGDMLHAVVVDDSGFPANGDISTRERFKRAVYLMDERNIVSVYSEGRKIF